MKTSHYIFFILAAGISLSGCDDKECVKKDCITGTYTMDIKVQKHVPVIKYDFGRPDVIPYDHQIIYNEVMDTTQEVCCLGRLPLEDSCYNSYTLDGPGLRIFEHNGQLYFKNGIGINSSGERVTFDILLTERGDSLIFDKSTSPSIGYFHRPSNDGIVNSSGNTWPDGFDLLYLSIDSKTLKGRWVFKELTDFCYIEMSDGERYKYTMGEFAEFTLTKVE